MRPWDFRLYRLCRDKVKVRKVRVSDRDSVKVLEPNRARQDRDSVVDRVQVLLFRTQRDRDSAVDRVQVLLCRAQRDRDSAAVDKVVVAAVLFRVAIPKIGNRVRDAVLAQVLVLVELAAAEPEAAVETNEVD